MQLPTKQGFKAGEFGVLYIDHRLIDHLQLAGIERLVEHGSQRAFVIVVGEPAKAKGRPREQSQTCRHEGFPSGGIAGIIQLRLESNADTHFVVATIFLDCVAEHLVFAAVIF